MRRVTPLVSFVLDLSALEAIQCVWMLLTYSFNGIEATTVCPAGMNYPLSCPQIGDPPDHTKCCRYYYYPACCQQRASTVCSSRAEGAIIKQYSYQADPGPSWATIWCPRAGDRDDQTLCAYEIKQKRLYMNCNSTTLIYGVVSGILCVFTLAGIVTGAICCLNCKGSVHFGLCKTVFSKKTSIERQRRNTPVVNL